MNAEMQMLLAMLIGYVLGCSNMSFYISKLSGVRIKEKGSKNYGASNTLALVGIKAGILVFIHDCLKAVAAVLLAKLFCTNVYGASAIAGMFAVLGHIFPIYLNFDGGKGYAAYIGLAIALHPIIGTAVFLLSVVFALVTDYVVASTFFTVIAMPIVALVTGNYFEAAVIAMTSVIILVKHKENIKNLISKNGKEMTIKAALKKKYKKADNENDEQK